MSMIISIISSTISLSNYTRALGPQFQISNITPHLGNIKYFEVSTICELFNLKGAGYLKA